MSAESLRDAVAEPADDAALDGQGRVLVLRVGAEELALPLPALREMLDAPVLTPVPLAPPALIGQLTLRDQHLPVLDLGVLLGVARELPILAGVALVAADLRYAIAADDVVDLWEPSEFVRRPLPAGGDARGLLAGVLHRGERIAGVVDPTALRGIVLATLRTIPLQ